MPNPSTAQLVARADSQSTATSNPSSSAGPTTPLAQWTAQTDRSCTTLLTTLSQSSSSLVSASGIAPCYNIPIFYANNGTFVADLRLYQIRDPSGDWAGLSAGGLEVGVQFPDAVVSAAQLEMGPLGRLQKRDGEGAMLEKRGVVVPVLLHTFDFDGKIDAGEDTDM